MRRHYLPDRTEAEARQSRERVEKIMRRTYFLENSGAHQMYEIFRGEKEEKAVLHDAIDLMAPAPPVLIGKYELSQERELEVTEETIWRACPAVITGDLDFTMDLTSEADLVAFSPYFAAAMLMNPA